MSRTFRLGTFIVGTLAILAIGVFLIGSRQYLFSSTYQLETTFKNVAGLDDGADVRVGGIHKGTVRQVRLPVAPDGAMTVVMAMESATRKVIRTDSVASIQTEGLLGSKYVEISFGSNNAPTVNDGSKIGSQPTLDISDLMRKTNDILDTTKETMVNVEKGAGNLADVSSKIDRGEGAVGALVNDKTLYNELNKATAQATLGATAFQENMEALKHNFFLRGFFNQRGYEDLAKLTENEISALPSGPNLRTFSYDPAKLFDNTNSAKLKNQKILVEAGHFLEGNAFGSAVAVVSGGMTGDVKEIRQLTEARAMIVRDYLVNNFKMDDTRLKTMGVGKSPQSANGGLVEIIVYPPETTIAASPH